MNTYAINTEKNGIELTFSKIPTTETREHLKAQGWRWSRFGGFWYNRNTPENEQTAKQYADGITPQPTQKHAPAVKKSAFTADKVADRYPDKVLGYVKLSSGKYIPFEKQAIETRLCFGYDELQPETVDSAREHCNKASTQYETFENLQTRYIDRDIERIERALAVQQEKDSGAMGCYSMCDFVWEQPNDWRGELLADYTLHNSDWDSTTAMNAADLQAVLDGLKAKREYVQKQARTYWKRFGGSKLHCWTYSVND